MDDAQPFEFVSAGGSRHSLRLRICPNGLWHSPPNDDGMVLEMFQIQIGQLTKAIGVQSALVAFAFKVVF